MQEFGVTGAQRIHFRTRRVGRKIPPAGAGDDDVDASLKAPRCLRADQLPAHGHADTSAWRLKDTVVAAADVIAVLPHRRDVLVVAEGRAVRESQNERVVAVGATAINERTSDDPRMSARQALQKLPRCAIGRRDRIEHAWVEGHRRGEELRQDDPCGSGGERFFRQTFGPRAVRFDVAEVGLHLNRGDSLGILQGHCRHSSRGQETEFRLSPATRARTPRMTNRAAATQRISLMFTRCASASPIHTAGTLAIIMPSVVPSTTATSES